MHATHLGALLLGIAITTGATSADTTTPATRTCGQVLLDTATVGSSEIAAFTAASSDECCAKCAVTDDCKLFTFGGAWKGVGSTCHLLRNATGTEAMGVYGPRYNTIFMSDFVVPPLKRTCDSQFPYVLASGDVLERLSDVASIDACCAKCAEAAKCALFSYGGAWKGKGPECVLLADFASGEYAGPGGFIYTTVTMSDYAGPSVQVSTSPTPSANTGDAPSPAPLSSSSRPPSTPAPAPAQGTSGPAPTTSKAQC